MGLDISKITNAELRELAYKYDRSNNNVLDAEEFVFFKEEVQELESVSSEDFNQAMGLYKTETAQATEATVPTEKSVSEDKTEDKKELTKDEKKALKLAQNNIKNDIEGFIEGSKKARITKDSSISLDNLTAKLAKKNPTGYKEIIADVQEVVDFVKATNFNSKKKVEALEKQIKKNKDFSDFQKDLADKMVELAKREQIKKEANVLVGIYDGIKADKTKAQNFTAYLKDVKTEMEKRNLKDTSYYSDEAFKDLENIVAEDVKELSLKKRKEMIKNGAEHVSEKEVKESIQNSLPETDKFARDIVKNEKDMNGVTGRWLDKDRTAEDLEKISEKDLKDELGKDLFNVLRTYLENHQNADGTYNVRDLSDKLFDRVGYDVWMNMSDDTQMSELQGAKNELDLLTGRDLEDKDIKKIMNLVHIKKEPKDRNVLNALKKSIIPGIAGAVAGASTYSRLDVTQRVHLKMDANLATDMIDQLKAAGEDPKIVTNSDGSVTVDVLQRVLQDNRALMALAGAGIGVLTGTLMNLIFGMENKEKSCISIADFDLSDERYTNIDNYEEYIRETQLEAKANLVVALAKTFKEEYGDDWAKHYDSMLKKFAGRGSVLNCLEFRAGQLVDIKNEKETISDNNQTEQTCLVDVNKETDTETIIEVDQTYIHHRKKGDGWKGLVDAYYPELVAKYNGQYYGNNGAIRALQKELCRDDHGVLDTQKLKQVYTAQDIPKEIKMPLKVEGVDRVIGEVKPVSIDGNGDDYIKPLDKVGRNEILKVKQVTPGLYTATDGCDDQKASGSTPKEAVRNLKKTTGKTYSNESDFQ